jgi:hypothetical protein
LSPAVLEKLRFVHELVLAPRRESTAPAGKVA